MADLKLTAEQKLIVRNYNRRVKYLENYGVQFLPEHERVRDLAKQFKTQRDLNRRLKQLQKFNAANAKKIVRVGVDKVKMSKYQRDILVADAQLSRKRTEKEQRQIEKEKGKQQWSFMYGPRYKTLETSMKTLKKSISKMTKAEIEKTQRISQSVKYKHQKDQTFINNLITIMFENSRLVKDNPAQVNRIADKMRQLTAEEAVEFYNGSRHVQYQIEFYEIYKDIRKDAYALGQEIVKYHSHLDAMEQELNFILSKEK